MRSLVLACAFLLSAAPTAAAAAPRPTFPKAPSHAIKPFPAQCPSLTGQPAARPGESLKPRKLTELPPANAYHAVLRRGPDGCPDPLLVGYQYRPKP